ncbi:ZP3 protein, partial [Rhinopomastus cyanomelas]|nr:ZP3 protein [Rhinopomastus cyanomelas]
STTAPQVGGSWLEPDPSPSPWTATTPGEWGRPVGGRGQGLGVTEPFTPLHRVGSVSSGAVQPRWGPASAAIAQRRPPSFTLALYDGSWAAPLQPPYTHPSGEPLNVEASLATDPAQPLGLFVERCGLGPRGATRPGYELIADG